MALEKSILDENGISKVLKENWDITVRSLEKLDIGTSNCFVIHSKEETYFLKEFHSDIKEQDIAREARVLDVLSKKGIPSTRFLETVNGKIMVHYKAHILVLERYISGETYGYEGMPKEMLPQMAELLAKIHLALDGADIPLDMDEEWINTDAIPKYEALLVRLEQNKEELYYERIKEDLLYKRSILIQYQEKLRSYFNGLTYRATHGDFQGCQIIGRQGKICAVIDFSSARTLPAVWEIMRSFIQSSQEARKQCKIDIDGLYDYVKSYMEIASLNKQDLKSMPFVYLYQLLRSSYGYREYLETNSEDREGLIAFAFWRTAICRNVLSHAQEIVEKLERITRED